MKYIICYDIAHTHRRNRVAKTLEGFGERIHESVFECELRAAQFGKLCHAVRKHVCPVSDTLRAYPLCERDCPDIIHLGRSMGRAQRDAYVV